MLRLRSTHFPGSGRRLLGRSKKNIHQPWTAVAWIQFCLSQHSAPVVIIVGFQPNQKECHEQGGRSRFSTPWASLPFHRDAHLARSCCARVQGGHRSVENQSTLQDPYALLTFRIGPERRWVNRLPWCGQYVRSPCRRRGVVRVCQRHPIANETANTDSGVACKGMHGSANHGNLLWRRLDVKLATG